MTTSTVEEEFINPDEVGEMISLDENEDMVQDDEENPTSNTTIPDDSIQGFFGHKDSIFSIDVYGDTVVTGDSDDTAIVWNKATGETIKVLTGHKDSVIGSSFSPDKSLIATASMDGTVRIYSASNYSLLHVCEGPGSELEWFCWHPLGSVVLAGSSDTTVWMWNAATGATMQTFVGHTGSVTSGEFSSDGKQVITGNERGDLIVFNPKTGEVIWKARALHETAITAIATHPTQRIILTAGADGTVKVVNLDTGKVLQTLGSHSESVEGVGFSLSNSRLCASVSVDGLLKIFDLTTGQCRVECKHSDPVTKMQWHPTQNIIFTSCMDGVIRQWDALTGEIIMHYYGHTAPALAFVLTNDNQQIISGSDDQSALVFDLATGHKTAVPVNEIVNDDTVVDNE